MRIAVLAFSGLLALAASSAALAQQTTSAPDQSSNGQARQTSSTDWSSPANATPEQPGGIYQAKGRDSGGYGGAGAQDSAVLPGALNPGTESLGNPGPAEPKD